MDCRFGRSDGMKLLMPSLALLMAGCATAPPDPPLAPPFMVVNPAYDVPADPAQDVAAVRAAALAATGKEPSEAQLMQNLVILFAHRARQTEIAGFNDVTGDWRRPALAIVHAKAPIDREAFLVLAAPELRPSVEFHEVRFARGEEQHAIDRIFAIFGADGPVCGIGYDKTANRLRASLKVGADAEDVRARLPADLSPWVKLEWGGCPVILV